jgi:hypothetical protein
MAWSDKPTPAQIGALASMIQWKLTVAECDKAIVYLRDNSTRKELSDGLKRVRNLYIERKLSRDNVFASPIYKNMK